METDERETAEAAEAETAEASSSGRPTGGGARGGATEAHDSRAVDCDTDTWDTDASETSERAAGTARGWLGSNGGTAIDETCDLPPVSEISSKRGAALGADCTAGPALVLAWVLGATELSGAGGVGGERGGYT